MRTGALVLVGMLVVVSPLAAQGVRARTGEEVYERALAAQGGREAWAKHESLHVTGKMTIAGQNLEGTVETWRRRPSHHRSRVVFPVLGVVESGFDGTVAWSLHPATGPRVLEGQERAVAEQDALWSDDPQTVRTRTLQGEAQFEGQTCVVVRLVMKSGEERTSYYDVATGLPVGTTFVRRSAQGDVPVTVIVSDFREVEGVKLPFRTVQRVGVIEQVLTTERVEWDRNAELSAFALPAEIRALISK